MASFFSTGAIGLFLLTASPALSQPVAAEKSGEEQAPPDVIELVPPRLQGFVEAEYPAAAKAAGLEADVGLTLTIDASGSVVDATVVEPQGNGFDEAATEAARAFVFAPARRGGTPVGAKIRYTYTFRLEAPPEPMPPIAALAPPPASPPAPAKAEAESSPVEVLVEGESDADRARRSSEAVHVVETEHAKRESSALSEVLRRSQGVGVRSTGGLGSDTRFSLDGMTDDQVRFFVDSVPLDFAGFGLGLAVVPVNLVERIELYRGVVPVRFGVDALGGAVNLVTDTGYRKTRAAASYQVGSFGTYRGTLSSRYRLGSSPFVVGFDSFVDRAKNDYPIVAEVPNERGRPVPTTVYRFHDAYTAHGGSLEFGVVEVPWARRLLLRVFTTDFEKEVQHNTIMSVPYGEVEKREHVDGAILRYEHSPRTLRRLRVEAFAGYARRRIEFRDEGAWIYDWFGRRIRRRVSLGEIETADDTTFHEDRVLGRLGLSYRLGQDHQVRVGATLRYSGRAGENRLYESSEYLDPATARQRLVTVLTGAEYEVDAVDDRLENVVFVKNYQYSASGEEGDYYGSARIETGFAEKNTRSNTFGAGNALRFRFVDWLYAKASYEYATRLPDADEVYGDGALVLSNLTLAPEKSHNANVGISVDGLELHDNELRADLNAFLRASDKLIIKLPVAMDLEQNHNVWGSQALGLEAALGWTSAAEYLSVDGNLTWADVRNTSESGPFATYEGDRIPNRPYLYANVSARGRLAGVNAANDEVLLAWHTSYVHAFFRSWESVGRPEYKIVVDEQVVHTVALTYLVRSAFTVSSTLEIQNLTDARVYDFVGVQKPGRAFYFKGTVEY